MHSPAFSYIKGGIPACRPQWYSRAVKMRQISIIMTRVTLDIPNEKMPSFIRLILELGIDRHSISSRAARDTADTGLNGRDRHFLRKLYRSFLLFDWEFFSNELEFE